MEMHVLTTLLTKKVPRVAAQLERLEVDPLHVVDPWCASLFTRTLPAETCARVWDWLFAEGPKALLRVGLALFRMNESALVSVVHGFQLTRTLSWRVGRCYQVEVLAKVCWVCVGVLCVCGCIVGSNCTRCGVCASPTTDGISWDWHAAHSLHCAGAYVHRNHDGRRV